MIIPPLAAEFWVVVGGVAGVIAAVAACIALIPVLRRRDGGHAGSPPPDHPEAMQPEPPIELKLSWMFPVHHDGSVDVPCIGLTLINRLGHEVNWMSASIDLQDGSGRHMQLIGTALPGMNLPLRVSAHDSNQTIVPAQQLRESGFDLSRPIAARAALGMGESIVSQPWTAEH